MLLIVEDPLSGIGVDTDGLVLPMSIRSTETIPPTARGVIISGEVYTDAVPCMAELGYTITDCLA
jgi:hypothetical protein